MTVGGGFEPGSSPAERRAIFDLRRLITPTPWVNVTFQNAWVDYVTGDYQPTSYSKTGWRVYIRGAMNSGVNGTVAFTLPVGFRPPNTLELNCVTWTSGGTNYTDGVLLIAADGTCRGYRYGTTPSYMNLNVDFSVQP